MKHQLGSPQNSKETVLKGLQDRFPKDRLTQQELKGHAPSSASHGASVQTDPLVSTA